MLIDRFMDNYGFLSNFWDLEFPIVDIHGFSHYHVEGAYQASKTLGVDKISTFLGLSASSSKRHGKNLNLRPDWDSIKFLIMMDLVRQKFVNNPKLLEALLDTDEAKLIEGNHWHDQYWGDCSCDKHKNSLGGNHLGRILMFVRGALRDVERI